MEDLVSHAEELALSLEDCGKSLGGCREAAVWKEMGLRRACQDEPGSYV